MAKRKISFIARPTKENTFVAERRNKEVDRKLGERIQAGDQKARNELIVKYQGLVYKLARGWHKHVPEMQIDDLAQEGNLGLIRAARRYDPTRGVAFSSYATWYISFFCRRYIQNNMLNAIRIPVSSQKKRRDAIRDGSIDDFEDRSSDLARAAQVCVFAYDPLAEPSAGVIFELADPSCCDGKIFDDFIDQRGRYKNIERALQTANSQEREVIKCRFFLDMTLEETAEQLHWLGLTERVLTRERIRQIEAKLLKGRLRSAGK